MVVLTVAVLGTVTTGIVATATYAVLRWRHALCGERHRQFSPYKTIYDDSEFFWVPAS